MPSNRLLFFTAALFNWLIALAFLLAYQRVFVLLGLSPIPEHPVYLHLFAALVAVFGLGYYLASVNFTANRNLVVLGIVGKFFVFLIALFYFINQAISWQLTLLALVDLLYCGLFIVALKKSPEKQ